MVEVSEKFISLAQQNGRHVYCKITAGGETFLDDRILEFDFDDVIHPDWYTIGTTCANRFHFSVRYEGEIAAGAQVLPYISFDNEEWCPLGVFWISRRYVRGKTISITAYDRMYDLDMEYSYGGELPAESTDIMLDVCAKAGLEAVDAGIGYDVKYIPEQCTVRDMIGYIAGLNRSCAKIDRYGRLVFRGNDITGFTIRDSNCVEVQRNLTHSVVTCLKYKTDSELLTAGSGAEISTLEIYNPLMTQHIVDIHYSLYKPFDFYGAELDMQGMPFLESGDRVYLLDGSLIYPLVISEIEYHYDGGLRAKLHSKNKIYTDSGDDLEDVLERLKEMLAAGYYRHVNDAQIALKSEPQIVADFDVMCAEESFAQIDVNFTLKNFTADYVVVGININGDEVPHVPVQTLGDADYDMLHVYHLAEGLSAGKNRIYITMQTLAGDAYILPGQMIATVVGHGIAGGGGDRGAVVIAEHMETVPVNPLKIIPAGMSELLYIEKNGG